MASTKMAKMIRETTQIRDESIGATRKAGSEPVAGVIHRVSPGEPPARLMGLQRMAEAAMIPLDRIEPDPLQPRKEFEPEAIARLARSLEARGQLLPIRVRWDDPAGLYRVICGERRTRAARSLGWESIRCVIQDGEVEPGELLLDQITENCVREDLGPIEQATAFRAVMEARGWSGRALAKNLGISQATVSRSLALLGLPEEVQEMVDSGKVPPSTALELARVTDEAGQVAIAGQVAGGKISRAEVREVMHGVSPASPSRPSRRSRPAEPADWRAVPTTAVGFPPGLLKQLVDSEIDTAGEAWRLVESGSLVEVHEFAVVDAKLVEAYLVGLREEAGDPAPMTLATPDPVASDGRGVPGRTAPEPERAKLVDVLAGLPPWQAAPFTTSRERVLAEVDGVEIVARSGSDAFSMRLLVALNDAVARVRNDLGLPALPRGGRP